VKGGVADQVLQAVGRNVVGQEERVQVALALLQMQGHPETQREFVLTGHLTGFLCLWDVSRELRWVKSNNVN
jgi:hypothetical protein